MNILIYLLQASPKVIFVQCAAVDKISTDTVHCAVPRRELSLILFEMKTCL